jgi:hypothetical protein
MIEAFGGKEAFEAKLDEMFNAPSATTGREQADVTGLVGQYAQGNEPSHHMAYLYNYVNKPEKTKEKIDYILNEFYKNSPDGLIGNEDCGQMSAWYVLSSMGMYFVSPGDGFVELTEPQFETVVINPGREDKITTEKKNYLLAATAYRTPDLRVTYPVANPIVPVPTIEAEGKGFTDKMTVTLKSSNPNDVLYYDIETYDFSAGCYWNYVPKYKPYKEPLVIDKSVGVYAYAENKGVKSSEVSAVYEKKPNNYTIKLNSKYNSSYSAGGNDGLIDGILGGENWRKGDWQGYQSQDFEAVIDLQKNMKVSDISASFLQDSRSWILMPTKVEYYASEDNVNFTLVQTVNNTIDPKQEGNIIKTFDAKLAKIKARYIKVKAYNFGKLPQWHQGAGGDAFIFIDEITVK